MRVGCKKGLKRGMVTVAHAGVLVCMGGIHGTVWLAMARQAGTWVCMMDGEMA